MRVLSIFFAFLAVNAVAIAGYAQERSADGLEVTGHNKTAIIATERMKQGWYDGAYHFSPAVRAGHLLE
jgi:hypothetical protein